MEKHAFQAPPIAGMVCFETLARTGDAPALAGSEGSVLFLPAGYGVSLMEVRERFFPETNAVTDAENLPGTVPLQRFLSLMRKHGVRTLALERPQMSQDIAEENEDLERYGRFDRRHVVIRLTALKVVVREERELADLPEDAWLGVAIWKQDRGEDGEGKEETCSRLFESVARRGAEPNNYIRGEPEREVVCGPARRRLKGHLFCQQNGVTNVCSHAAIRTVTDSLVPGGLSYRRINQQAGVDHQAVSLRTKPEAAGGLSPQEIAGILRHSGMAVQLGIYHAEERDGLIDRMPYQDRLYGTMESGYPSLLIFGSLHNGVTHVVPVFGHTMNRDMWGPRADGAHFSDDQHFPLGKLAGYSPSHLWLSAFIMHDDGLGQNYCVPRHYLTAMKRMLPPRAKAEKEQGMAPLRQDILRLMEAAGPEGEADGQSLLSRLSHGADSIWQNSGVAYVLSIRPGEVKVDGADLLPGAYRLVQLLWNYLTIGGTWEKRIMEAMSQQTLILRPLLIQRDDYIAHLRKLRDWHPEGHGCGEELIHWVESVLEEIPDRVWMVELSIPELFPANFRKLGELIIRPEFDPLEQRWMQCSRRLDPACGLILARIPGTFLIPARMTQGKVILPDKANPKLEVPVFWCESKACALASHTALFGAEEESSNTPP